MLQSCAIGHQKYSKALSFNLPSISWWSGCVTFSALLLMDDRSQKSSFRSDWVRRTLFSEFILQFDTNRKQKQHYYY
jgi:hypothetical protein